MKSPLPIDASTANMVDAVDGKRLEKNMPERVAEGAKITLCNVDATVIVKESAAE